MKIERTKNAVRNVAFGFILKIYGLIVPFLMRTAMIYLMGVEYLGLNSLFTSILQVLNLAELGVGSAMVFSMYKPIAENDEKKICALMNLYRVYYRIIGCVVLVGGLAILPFIPVLIKGEVPGGLNVYVLYLLNLFATVLTYWLFAYRNSLFLAHQRTDVISKVTIVTDTLKYGSQLLVLSLFHNYYYFVLCVLLSQIVNNFTIAYFSKKQFPAYLPQGAISKEEKKEINQRIKDLFTSKLGGTIVNSADTIVISSFLGLRLLAIYQNYYYIIGAIMGIVVILFNSVLAGSGNSIIKESREKNFEDFRKISWITYWIVGYAICGLCCLYQTLMKVWVGVELLLPDNFVLLFCIYFWGMLTVQLVGVYKDAAGIWHQDRFRPLISGLVNLFLNILMVNWIGLSGVLWSTIISIYLISLPWLMHNVFTNIFNGFCKKYIKDVLIYLVVTICVTIVTKIVCDMIPDGGFAIFMIKVGICTLVCNCLFIMIYGRTKLFKQVVKTLSKTRRRSI